MIPLAEKRIIPIMEEVRFIKITVNSLPITNSFIITFVQVHLTARMGS